MHNKCVKPYHIPTTVCDYNTKLCLRNVQFLLSSFTAFNFCDDGRILHTWYWFSKITSNLTFNCQSHPIMCSAHPRWFPCTSNWSRVFHEAGYNGIQCRTESVRPNFSMRVCLYTLNISNSLGLIFTATAVLNWCNQAEMKALRGLTLLLNVWSCLYTSSVDLLLLRYYKLPAVNGGNAT